MGFHTIKNAARAALFAALGGLAGTAHAGIPWNVPVGVTPISHEVYFIHMMVGIVCTLIGVVVFGVMIIALFRFRKSKGAQPAHFHHSTLLEILWTIVPVIILVAMAVPAAKTLVRMADTTDPDLNIKITGYQWKWQYDYIQNGFSFFSMLAPASDKAAQLGSGIDPNTVDNYLRDVDHPLVVPTGEKIRLLLTSDDVIHSWWMPDFGGKTDANPGFVNSMWIKVEEPGVYRGACAELCGRWHGFMPIVVVAKKPDDYLAWVKAMKAGGGKYVSPYDGSLEDTGSPVVFSDVSYNKVLGTPAGAVVPTGTTVSPAMASALANKPGSNVQPPASTPAAAAAQAWDMKTAMEKGKQVYAQNCSSCHQPDGKGNPEMGAKPIAGSPIANGPMLAHIQFVLKGKGIMPAWGNILNDTDLAAVITFERNSFGNHKGDLVKPSDVKAAR
ncbi:MAG TPA: cytochrome c oxidase subunit II [Gammaproteobacteria bacterium]|nr:cytochrome c oxidase subunit II [Gammaproteobacteria bacterium]